jgi:hypothetical protein
VTAASGDRLYRDSAAVCTCVHTYIALSKHNHDTFTHTHSHLFTSALSSELSPSLIPPSTCVCVISMHTMRIHYYSTYAAPTRHIISKLSLSLCHIHTHTYTVHTCAWVIIRLICCSFSRDYTPLSLSLSHTHTHTHTHTHKYTNTHLRMRPIKTQLLVEQRLLATAGVVYGEVGGAGRLCARACVCVCVCDEKVVHMHRQHITYTIPHTHTHTHTHIPDSAVTRSVYGLLGDFSCLCRLPLNALDLMSSGTAVR